MQTQIHVPREHDSLSQITLGGQARLIRFTYNDTFDTWSFGIYELNQKPIIQGLKIVPNFPLNLFCASPQLGDVHFIAQTKLAHIGYSDFWEEKASFWLADAPGGAL